MKKALYWHKRDFRLLDNDVLDYAIKNDVSILPFYVWEEWLMSTYEMSDFHKYAVMQGVQSLTAHYKKYSVPFLDCYGDIEKVLDYLFEKFKFDTLLAYQEHGTRETFDRDIRVLKWCKEKGVEFLEFQPYSVVRKLKSRDEREKHWDAYINSKIKLAPAGLKTFISQKEFDKISQIYKKDIENLYKHIKEISELRKYGENLQMLSEKNAYIELKDFLENRSIYYRGSISSPNTALKYGSRLSPFLAWGFISSRFVYQSIKKREIELIRLSYQNPEDKMISRHKLSLRAFLSRMHWREHFIQRLEDFPDMNVKEINKVYEEVNYLNDKEEVKKRLEYWVTGNTGELMVDACMRCLNVTGFINFRMRAMCISYAIFGLHLHWRKVGEELAKLFYDYEPGIHWSQVQMQAGIVGINTIRVYSPHKQLLDQDKDLKFVKIWIPEIRGLTDEEIKKYNEEKLKTYISPIVNFKENSKIMKDIMYGVKKSEKAKIEKSNILDKHGSRVFKKG